MFFSNNVQKIKQSRTSELSDLALRLKEQGQVVINMASGELPFKPQKDIIDEACRIIKTGQTLYTEVAGKSELRYLICEKLNAELDTNYKIDQVIVSNGGKQVIFNALKSTLNPGDEVIIISPYWVSYPEMVRVCGAIPKILRTKRSESFAVDPKKLDKLISRKTRWLIINSPNNPTGHVYSPENLVQITEVLKKHTHVWILSDDIYEKLNYTSEKNKNLINIDRELHKRTLVVNGFSKGYCMTGWRLGYGAGPSKIINVMKKLQSQSTSAANTIAQSAGIKALELDASYFDALRKSLIRKRDIVAAKLSNIEGIELQKGHGAFYLFPSITSFIGKRLKNKKKITSDTSFCLNLLINEKIAIVPGSSFGCEGSVRISYAHNKKDLQDACERIKNFCDGLN
ncbi:pyridoxal phosphate-dependent aminotransferase [Paracoccaceae bacterium]|nr:pyridoxal phosphate-dependent aminotransferase [Paracoccaceae bacterium]